MAVCPSAIAAWAAWLAASAANRTPILAAYRFPLTPAALSAALALFSLFVSEATATTLT